MTHRSMHRRQFVAGVAALAALATGSRSGLAQDRTASAMAAAEELSRLEATEHIPALYTLYARMHPDAQALVPRHVVIGWFREHWQPKGPSPALAVDVAFVDWTWPVNGVTYPGVAEVSFTQTFAAAPPIADVVRLAEVDGEWRWFFGRDRAWVDEQIAIYDARAYIPQGGEVPFELHRVVDADPLIVTSLPLLIGAAQAEAVSDARQLPDYAARMPNAVQYREAEFPVGYAMALPLRAEVDMAAIVERVVREGVEAPPSRIIGWNLEPENGVPWAHMEHFASDAVGNAQTITFGRAGGSTLWQVSFTDSERLAALAQALVRIAAP